MSRERTMQTKGQSVSPQDREAVQLPNPAQPANAVQPAKPVPPASPARGLARAGSGARLSGGRQSGGRQSRKLGSAHALLLAAVLLVIGPVAACLANVFFANVCLANVCLANVGLGSVSSSIPSAFADDPKLDKKYPGPSGGDLAGCLQKCFDKYLSNVDRCKKAFCSYLFGVILLGCENERLAHCEGEAEGIYEACKDSCQSQPSH
jgi:hypothetical protein